MSEPVYVAVREFADQAIKVYKTGVVRELKTRVRLQSSRADLHAFPTQYIPIDRAYRSPEAALRGFLRDAESKREKLTDELRQVEKDIVEANFRIDNLQS